MDLLTLIAVCALNVEPKLMHALIWKQSGGEPWLFSAPRASLPHALPTFQAVVREAQVTRRRGDRIRAGSTRVSINPRSLTAAVFAPCPNVAIAVQRLTQLVERCNTTSKPDPTHCAIAAYRGSWDRPDIGFADAVRSTVEADNAPNVDLPKDAYFDASDIASNVLSHKPDAALSTRAWKPDDRMRSCSRALLPTTSMKPNGTSADEQNGDLTAAEPRLRGPAATVPATSKAPNRQLFVSRSSE
jgi:hypothetical protein